CIGVSSGTRTFRVFEQLGPARAAALLIRFPAPALGDRLTPRPNRFTKTSPRVDPEIALRFLPATITAGISRLYRDRYLRSTTMYIRIPISSGQGRLASSACSPTVRPGRCLAPLHSGPVVL